MLLAIDIGFAKTGYSIFDKKQLHKCGVIETEKSKTKNVRIADDDAFRCAGLARQLHDLILKYEIKGILGELPTSGAQSARALKAMSMASAILSSVAAVNDVPIEWASPTEVKKVVTGKRSASKKEIMQGVINKFEGSYEKNGRGYKYTIQGQAYPQCTFEHIADSLGVYLSLLDGNLVKIFG